MDFSLQKFPLYNVLVELASVHFNTPTRVDFRFKCLIETKKEWLLLRLGKSRWVGAWVTVVFFQTYTFYASAKMIPTNTECEMSVEVKFLIGKCERSF